MGMLALLLFFLATFVGIDAQGCTIGDVEDVIRERLGEIEGTVSSNISLIDANPNCLATSVEHGLYSSISMSVRYATAENDSRIKEARYDYLCFRKAWFRYNEYLSKNPYFNGTRDDCSDCTNGTVNDHHCESCHSDCMGLNKCHGSSSEECCNFIDGSNCTDNCGENRKANSTFHCVEDDCDLECENGATLTESCSCECRPGYNGSTCSVNIDECNPNPCQNEGACTDGINDYNCTCVPGYTGSNCETNEDDCEGNPCQNGGTCVDGINDYNCTCVPGYTGSNCSTNENDCNLDPCQNGGTCVDGINSYNCICVPGYTGSDCETDHNECEPNPCQNGGTCANGINGYNCTCAFGFIGINCATINNCEPNPCHNGGTCYESNDDYNCTCTECFTGMTCEIPKNRCICPDITVAFTLPSYQVLESNGPAQPVLRLSRPVDCCSTISVWVYVEGIDAKWGPNKTIHDFDVKSHVQVLFPGGTTTAKFDVHMHNDMLVEGSERFSVSIDPLSLPHGIVLGNTKYAEVEILDNDKTQVTFEKTKYTGSEADGFVEVTLKLSKPIVFTSSLQLEASDFTTRGTCDYISSRHDVMIPFNQTTFSYYVPINDDSLFEIEETFTLEILASSLHSNIERKDPNRATIIITDDEEPLQVSLTKTEHQVNETNKVLESILLTLNEPAPCCLNVYVEVKDDTATGGGIDHSNASIDQYQVTFPTGVTCSSFNILITDDEFSEGDENFTFTIMEESLPYGVILGDNTTASVIINDNDIYLWFSSERFEGYENSGSLCITVTHDRPAMSDTTIEILEDSGTATSGADYDSGPYSVTIKAGDRSAEYCIDIYNDTMLEMNETFNIRINEAALHSDIVLMDPNTAKVTIVDDEYTLCFNQTSYSVKENIQNATLLLMLSTALQEDILVRFRYSDITAVANETNTEEFDYYASYTYPNFAIIPNGSIYLTLMIKIVDNNVLENNKLFRITALPPVTPLGHTECTTDVIIVDDDDFVLEFAKELYAVDDKNEPQVPVLKLKYPLGYNSGLIFPINGTVREIKGVGDRATGGWMSTISGADYVYQNYTFSFKDGEEEKYLRLIPIDDDIVESDENYTLVIQLPLDHHPRVQAGKINTTKITIYNDDVCYVSINRMNGEFLHITRPLAESVIVNITYNGDEHNITTISSEETKTRRDFPLPIPLNDINMITVQLPASFQSELPNVLISKLQDKEDQDLMKIDWYKE